jgi:hypothetical protein
MLLALLDRSPTWNVMQRATAHAEERPWFTFGFAIPLDTQFQMKLTLI